MMDSDQSKRRSESPVPRRDPPSEGRRGGTETDAADDGASRSFTRRNALRTLAGGAAATASLSTVGVAAAETQPDFDGLLDDVDGGYRDARGEDEVTVEVGAPGNGGDFAYSPAGLWIDPGTTVIWEWTGEGGGHDVAFFEGIDVQSEMTADPGVHFEYTFDDDETGIHKYVCTPHEGLDMYGAIAVGDDVQTVEVEDGAVPLPGGPFGVAAVITLLLVGISAVGIQARGDGNYYRSLQERRDRGEPISAELAALAALIVSIFVTIAIVITLVV